MKLVVETSAIRALLKGTIASKVEVSMLAKGAIGVPQPVVAEVTTALAQLDDLRWPDSAVLRQWKIVEQLFVRCPWTDEVTLKLAQVRTALAKAGIHAAELDVTVAAHALAHDAFVVVGSPVGAARLAPIAGVCGVRVQRWGHR